MIDDIRRAAEILDRLTDADVEWAIRTLVDDPSAGQHTDVVAFVTLKASQYVTLLAQKATLEICRSC